MAPRTIQRVPFPALSTMIPEKRSENNGCEWKHGNHPAGSLYRNLEPWIRMALANFLKETMLLREKTHSKAIIMNSLFFKSLNTSLKENLSSCAASTWPRNPSLFVETSVHGEQKIAQRIIPASININPKNAGRAVSANENHISPGALVATGRGERLLRRKACVEPRDCKLADPWRRQWDHL